jgi:hypothetical protein
LKLFQGGGNYPVSGVQYPVNDRFRWFGTIFSSNDLQEGPDEVLQEPLFSPCRVQENIL